MASKGLVLNWDSAHCLAIDAANRNMRARRAKRPKRPKLKERWSRADYFVYCETLERLCMLWVRANLELPYHGPIDLRAAWANFATTRGQGVYCE